MGRCSLPARRAALVGCAVAWACGAPGSDDGRLDDGAPIATPLPLPPLTYPYGPLHSPLDARLETHLRAVAARDPGLAGDVFAKIGDSISAAPAFMACFEEEALDLGAYAALAPARAYFRAGDAGGVSPFARASVAAHSGWTARRALFGDPSPVRQELDALRPRAATVLFGTNEAGNAVLPAVGYEPFLRSMITLVDGLLARGTVPVLSSIPPRGDYRPADARVPVINGLVRALAASRGVPFVDLHRALLPLPRQGLTPDRIHLAPAPEGACVFTAEALAHGANVHNLRMLEALDRLHRALTTTTATTAAEVPLLIGEGTRETPYRVDALPFSGATDTTRFGAAQVDAWTACSPGDAGGPEVRYRFTITGTTTRVAATVVAGPGATIDVQLVHAGRDGDGCIAQHADEVVADLPPGDYDLVVDTFVRAGVPQPGEAFLFMRTIEH